MAVVVVVVQMMACCLLVLAVRRQHLWAGWASAAVICGCSGVRPGKPSARQAAQLEILAAVQHWRW